MSFLISLYRPTLSHGEGFEWDESGNQSFPSWFGFQLLVKPESPFSHSDLAKHLSDKKIGNQMFFGGNLVRQLAFVNLRSKTPMHSV